MAGYITSVGIATALKVIMYNNAVSFCLQTQEMCQKLNFFSFNIKNS